DPGEVSRARYADRVRAGHLPSPNSAPRHERPRADDLELEHPGTQLVGGGAQLLTGRQDLSRALGGELVELEQLLARVAGHLLQPFPARSEVPELHLGIAAEQRTSEGVLDGVVEDDQPRA